MSGGIAKLASVLQFGYSAMLVAVGYVDRVPILPDSFREWREAAENRYRNAIAERDPDSARFDRELFRQQRWQHTAVSRLDQVKEADGEHRGGE